MTEDPKDDIRRELEVLLTNAGIVRVYALNATKGIEPQQLVSKIPAIAEAMEKSAKRIDDMLDRTHDMSY